jgi:hypothetical protein
MSGKTIAPAPADIHVQRLPTMTDLLTVRARTLGGAPERVKRRA